MTNRITKTDLTWQIELTNKQLKQASKGISGVLSVDEDRTKLGLSWANGGVRIVRERTQEPIGKRGTKREAFERLEMMRKALDIIMGH